MCSDWSDASDYFDLVGSNDGVQSQRNVKSIPPIGSRAEKCMPHRSWDVKTEASENTSSTSGVSTTDSLSSGMTSDLSETGSSDSENTSHSSSDSSPSTYIEFAEFEDAKNNLDYTSDTSDSSAVVNDLEDETCHNGGKRPEIKILPNLTGAIGRILNNSPLLHGRFRSRESAYSDSLKTSHTDKSKSPNVSSKSDTSQQVYLSNISTSQESKCKVGKEPNDVSSSSVSINETSENGPTSETADFDGTSCYESPDDLGLNDINIGVDSKNLMDLKTLLQRRRNKTIKWLERVHSDYRYVISCLCVLDQIAEWSEHTDVVSYPYNLLIVIVGYMAFAERLEGDHQPCPQHAPTSCADAVCPRHIVPLTLGSIVI